MKTRTLFSLFLGLYVSQTFASNGDKYESELLAITETIENGELIKASGEIDKFLSNNPKSRVGYLLKADINKALSGQFSAFGEGIKQQKLDRDNFKHELVNRSSWRSDSNKEHLNKIPASILDMGTDKYVVLGEMSTGRFFLFGNKQGKPYLVKDYYMSIGKKGYGKQVEGDNRTPLGVYKITREIKGNELPDLYGSGAFPINYPNAVDKWRKRTGYGIWLHGTPSETYSRSPYTSEGCFVLSNEDYKHVAPYIRDAKNPKVLLLETISWLSPAEHQVHKENYLSTLKSWVSGWESLDLDRYFSLYNEQEFNFGKTSFAAWKKHKQAVSERKTFVQVMLEISGMYLYPGEKETFTVDFKQYYNSNNYQGIADKTLLWRKTDLGKWKIVYEGKQI